MQADAKRKKEQHLVKEYAPCRYCGTQIFWREKLPYFAEGLRHRCENLPKRTKPVTELSITQDVERLLERIVGLETAIQKLQTPKQEPTDKYSKRIERLETLYMTLSREK